MGEMILSSVLGKCHSVTPSIFVCFMPFQVFPYYITLIKWFVKSEHLACHEPFPYIFMRYAWWVLMSLEWVQLRCLVDLVDRSTRSFRRKVPTGIVVTNHKRWYWEEILGLFYNVVTGKTTNLRPDSIGTLMQMNSYFGHRVWNLYQCSMSCIALRYKFYKLLLSLIEYKNWSLCVVYCQYAIG